MSELRTLTYVVKMDVGDGKEKTKQFRVTLKTMEQDAKKASVEVDKLAKTIGDKYGAKVTTAIDNTRTVKNEIAAATREATRSEKAFNRLANEYTHLTAKTGKSADVQEKMNALQRLGSNATLTQKKDIIRLVKAQQEQVKATNSTQRSFRGLRGQAQNLGWQLQDVAVQAQMGTNALVILGQQGSQLASGFGATGALVGAFIAVGAAVAGVLAPSLFKAGKSVDELKDKMIEWKKTIGLTKEQAQYLSEIEEKSHKDIKKSIKERTKDIKIKEINLIAAKRNIELMGKESKFNKSLVAGKDKLVKKINAEKALRQAEQQQLDASIKKIKSYNDAVGIGDKQVESNKALVESSTKRYEASTLLGSALLELQRDSELELASKNKMSTADKKLISDSWDLVIAKQKESEALEDISKALEKQRIEQAKLEKSLGTQAKYDPNIKLALLQKQYSEERSLLEGNTKALANIDQHYADERIKINGTVWEKMEVQARESLENTDQLMADSLDRFVSGTANAFANSIVNADDFGDAMKGVFKGALTSMIAYFAELAIQQALAWALGTAGNSAVQAQAATTMGFNTEAKVFEAGLNAFAATAAIPMVGPAAAPAAAAMAIAAAQPLATAAQTLSFAGVFDKGGKIPSGSAGIVAEYGDELVGGTMVYNGSQKSLGVTGREDTAKMMGGNTNIPITVNSSGNASPDAIARSIARALKKSNKVTDNAIFDSMNRGRNNRGKKFA